MVVHQPPEAGEAGADRECEAVDSYLPVDTDTGIRSSSCAAADGIGNVGSLENRRDKFHPRHARYIFLPTGELDALKHRYNEVLAFEVAQGAQTEEVPRQSNESGEVVERWRGLGEDGRAAGMGESPGAVFEVEERGERAGGCGRSSRGREQR